MGEMLDHLSVDMIGDVLRDWLRIQEHAEQLYQDLPPEWRRHVELTGSDYSGLASTFASHLHPDEREVTRAVLRDAIAGLVSLSQPERMIVLDVDAGNGASMAGDAEELAGRIMALEEKIDAVESLTERLTDLALRIERAVPRPPASA